MSSRGQQQKQNVRSCSQLSIRTLVMTQRSRGHPSSTQEYNIFKTKQKHRLHSQNHYIKDLSEIPTSHLDVKDLDKEVNTDAQALYWSLLGGIAWLLQTRADICPFVGFLQRAAQTPLIRHVASSTESSDTFDECHQA